MVSNRGTLHAIVDEDELARVVEARLREMNPDVSDDSELAAIDRSIFFPAGCCG